MKVLVLSDLHTEFVAQCWALPEELPEFDVAVLAGDEAVALYGKSAPACQVPRPEKVA